MSMAAFSALEGSAKVSSLNSESLSYQPFVDGLRAISILAVVAYHVGLPGVPGGFVGVDVFFVISGYLIITQIARGFAGGNFSFAGFWARRALRILPPYLLVILASLAIAPFVLVLPEEFAAFGQQVVWSAGMVVNHLFLSQQGYFDASADLKQLQHLWSLAVEEQFYVVAPLLIGALWFVGQKLGGAARRALIIGVPVVLFVVSLALCIVWTNPGGDTNYAFYLMPLRAWEFIAGGAVGFVVPYLRRLPERVISAVTLVGLALIIGSITAFSEATPFPSFWAALPAIGAAMLIAGGSAYPRGIIVRALAVRPMVWIGLVSYAWYLWHWPLLAFMRVYNFGDKILIWDLAMGVLSFVLAVGTHLLIERPIREWRQRTRIRMDWRPALMGITACAFVAVGGFVYPNWTAMEPRGQAYLTRDPLLLASEGCWIDLNNMRDDCATQKGARLGFLFGDSHAMTEERLLNTIAKKSGSELATLGGNRCAPLLGVDILNFYAGECEDYKARGIATIKSGRYKAQFAILMARWVAYTDAADKVPGGELGWELALPGEDAAGEDQKALFISGLRQSIETLTAAGVKRILIAGPTPEWRHRALECVSRADAYRISRDSVCGLKRADVEARRAMVLGWLKEAVAGYSQVRFVDPLNAFCDTDYCRPYDGQTLLFNDDDHPNGAGQARLYRALEPDFQWVFGG